MRQQLISLPCSHVLGKSSVLPHQLQFNLAYMAYVNTCKVVTHQYGTIALQLVVPSRCGHMKPKAQKNRVNELIIAQICLKDLYHVTE